MRPTRTNVLTACLMAVVIVIATASPAGAHTIAGIQATNYRSEILSISPADPTLTIRLLELGRQVKLTNQGATDVVVLGYEGEPYLRVGPRGTFENTRSPTLYKNQVTVDGSAPKIPRAANATAAPTWKRTGGGDSLKWRDQRTRWEGPDAPTVKAAPDRRQVVVPNWTIVLERSPSRLTVTGSIIYVPPPVLWPWLVVAGVLFVLVALAGTRRQWGPLLSAALSVLVAVDVVQSLASGLLTGDTIPVMLLKVLLGGIFSTVAWIVGIISISPLQRSQDGALVGAGVAGLFIALFSGLQELGTLTSSQVPSDLPDGLARAGVAIALGLGLGLVAAVFVTVRTQPDVSIAPPAAD